MTKIFNLDFDQLVTLLTPGFLRRKQMMAWLGALVKPVTALYNRFMKARIDDVLRESTNSTIPRLEYMLNSIFYKDGLTGDYDNRIRISNQGDIHPEYIYLGGVTQPIDENKPVFLDTLHIYTGAETGAYSVDFIVTVPAGITFDEVYMRSLVRSYALPDKTFIIQQL